MALSPNGTRAYVANSASGSVSVIDTATKHVTATIPVGGGPDAVAASPDGKRVYVNDGDSVSVIDTATNQITATIPIYHLSVSLAGLAVSPDSRHAYVSVRCPEPSGQSIL